MANYHCTTKLISRGQGRSGVQFLAYCADAVLHDRRLDESFSRADETGEVYVEFAVPNNSPQWISKIVEDLKTDKRAALQKLSDIVEEAENRKDSQIYRELEISLPEELSREENIILVDEYVNDLFASKGRVAIKCFHFDFDSETYQEKPHCHILLLMRNIEEKGLSFKKIEDSQFYLNKTETLKYWREEWANYQNRALERNGFEVRVDHRSYADRDINLEPQPKLGKNVREMQIRGIRTRKAQEFEEVRLRNLENIIYRPEIILDLISKQQSTFKRDEILKVLNRYIDDPLMFQILKDRIFSSAELIKIVEGRGVDPERSCLYTTKTLLKFEKESLERVGRLVLNERHRISDRQIELAIAKKDKEYKNTGGLSGDQKSALRHIVKENSLACFVGYAGSGKSTVLQIAKEIWEQAGYQVYGLAPTGKAAQNLTLSGFKSDTLSLFFKRIDHETIKLKPGSILVLDEAGMVNSRQFHHFLKIVEKKGLKAVVVGDGAQLQAVEAGGLFNSITERAKALHLTTILRQRNPMHRQATQFFGEGKAENALRLYHELGAIKFVKEDIPDIKLALSHKNYKALADIYRIASVLEKRFKDKNNIKEATKVLNNQRLSWREIKDQAARCLAENMLDARGDLLDHEISFKSLAETISELPGTSLFRKSVQEIFEIWGLGGVKDFSVKPDLRVKTKRTLIEDWKNSIKLNPNDSHLILSHSRKDVTDLNFLLRQYMSNTGQLKGKTHTFEVLHKYETILRQKKVEKVKREFAKGDKILFFENNYRVAVKNGDIGHIVSISSSEIIVRLDNKEKTEVRFDPSKYKYFDYGWATTIHKAQGSTADRVFLLGSYEQYRNLTYVGMSRHRESVKLYCSSFDFANEDQVFKGLCRIQEKTSPFDFITEEEAQELLKNLSFFSWGSKALKNLKDRLEVWSKNTFKDIFKRAQGKGLSQSADESDIYKEVSPFKEKDTVTHIKSNQTQNQSQTDDDLMLYRGVHTKSPKDGQSLSRTTYKSYGFNVENGKDWELVGEILSAKMEELSVYLLGSYKNKHGHEIVYGNKGSLRICVSGPKVGMYYNFETGEGGNAFKLIETELQLRKYETLQWAANWCGYDIDRSYEKTHIINPKEQGFEAKREDPIYTAALDPTEEQELKNFNKWVRLSEAPEKAPHPEKFLKAFEKTSGMRMEDLYPYKDAERKLLGYTVRLVNEEGVKQVLPLSWARSDTGQEGWRFIGFGETRSLYNQDKIAAFPEKPILLVEGEKTAIAAQDLIPGMVVVTWLGGVNGISKTDFKSLKEREVLIWPDNDEAGKKATTALESILREVESKSISTVDLPSTLPQKWDLADKIPDHLPETFIKDKIQEYMPEISFTLTPLDEYLSLQQKRGKYSNNYFGMDPGTKKSVGEIDDKLRATAYTLQQTKEYEKVIKLLGIDKTISADAKNYEILSSDHLRSRGDGLGIGF